MLPQLSSFSEPARAHAIDLVLAGELLAAKLHHAGTCTESAAKDLARVWRDHIVPLAP